MNPPNTKQATKVTVVYSLPLGTRDMHDLRSIIALLLLSHRNLFPLSPAIDELPKPLDLNSQRCWVAEFCDV